MSLGGGACAGFPFATVSTRRSAPCVAPSRRSAAGSVILPPAAFAARRSDSIRCAIATIGLIATIAARPFSVWVARNASRSARVLAVLLAASPASIVRRFADSARSRSSASPRNASTKSPRSTRFRRRRPCRAAEEPTDLGEERVGRIRPMKRSAPAPSARPREASSLGL